MASSPLLLGESRVLVDPARTEELVQDEAGRVVASRINTEAWSCLAYDTRGRVTTKTVAASVAEPAGRTVTYAYAGGNPPDASVTTVSDPAGTITTVTDWLDRVVSYADVWNKTTTTTYDPAGRVSDVAGPAGGPPGAAVHTTYDALGRPGGVDLNASRVATPTYDAASGLSTGATYPSGAGSSGNATSVAIGRDARGRDTALTWKLPGGALLASDAVTRSAAGRVVDQAVDGVDPRPGAANFAYSAGRLSAAWVPGHAYTYGFAPSGGCGALTTAGRNTNRTSVIDNTAPAISYCYGAGDRLTSSTDARFGAIAYDAHANTTAIGAHGLLSGGHDGRLHPDESSGGIDRSDRRRLRGVVRVSRLLRGDAACPQVGRSRGSKLGIDISGSCAAARTRPAPRCSSSSGPRGS